MSRGLDEKNKGNMRHKTGYQGAFYYTFVVAEEFPYMLPSW